jgi:uncharacterized protein
MSRTITTPLIEVRDSPIHGRGVFALRRIRKGQRIVEYTGERITPAVADVRYDDDRVDHPHVLLFIVDKNTIIDGGVGGSDARFINHSCDPNCEALDDEGRIIIEAMRAIIPGEEITYDYSLDRPGLVTRKMMEKYHCLCGAPNCRGTMLANRK